jgi:hypothetical protein
MPSGREESCPRRYFLDGLLQDAAELAGTELLDTRVEELAIRDGRVAGVRCSRYGRHVEISADRRRSIRSQLTNCESSGCL